MAAREGSSTVMGAVAWASWGAPSRAAASACSSWNVATRGRVLAMASAPSTVARVCSEHTTRTGRQSSTT